MKERAGIAPIKTLKSWQIEICDRHISLDAAAGDLWKTEQSQIKFYENELDILSILYAENDSMYRKEYDFQKYKNFLQLAYQFASELKSICNAKTLETQLRSNKKGLTRNANEAFQDFI